MSSITIRNAAGLDTVSRPYSRTIFVRPLDVDAPDLSKACGPRGLHLVSLPNPPYPDERYQCEAWLRPTLDIALSNDDGEMLIVAPDVEDFVSGEFAREAMYFARVVITVLADTVEEAVLKLISHDVPADQIEEFYLVDLTGHPPTLRVEVPDRVLPTPTVSKVPTPGRWSLDDYVTNNQYALAHRWKHEKFDPAFTGVFEIQHLDHLVRNGRAERFDLSLPARKLKHTDGKGVTTIADHAPGFGVINRAGLLEVWVHVSLEHRDYTALFQKAALLAHGFDYMAENERRYDLDHAFGRSISIRHSRANYVLLAPIARSVNRSWGHVEKYYALSGAGHPNMQQASWFSGPKMLGLYAPSLSRDKTIGAGISRIADGLFERDAISKREKSDAIFGLRELYQGVWIGQDMRRGIANIPREYPAERFDKTMADVRREASLRRKARLTNHSATEADPTLALNDQHG